MKPVLYILVLAVAARWGHAAPTGNDVIGSKQAGASGPDTVEKDLETLVDKPKQIQNTAANAGGSRSWVPGTAEFGFDPRTLKMIQSIVQQAEEAAEEEFVAELLQAVLLKREHLQEELDKQQESSTLSLQIKDLEDSQTSKATDDVPTKSPIALADVPQGHVQEDKDGSVSGTSRPVQDLIHERIKSLLSHLPYPLSERDLQPRDPEHKALQPRTRHRRRRHLE